MRALVVLLLLSSAAFADTITTKDGTQHAGRILDRTSTGYLFKGDDGGTCVIAFGDVADLQRGDDDVPLAETRRTLAPQDSRPPPMVMHLLELRKERSEVAGMFLPIFMSAMGTGGVLLGTVMATNDVSVITTNDRQAGPILALLGGCLLTGGVIIWVVRAVHRRTLDDTIETVEKKAVSLGFYVPAEG